MRPTSHNAFRPHHHLSNYPPFGPQQIAFATGLFLLGFANVALHLMLNSMHMEFPLIILCSAIIGVLPLMVLLHFSAAPSSMVSHLKNFRTPEHILAWALITGTALVHAAGITHGLSQMARTEFLPANALIGLLAAALASSAFQRSFTPTLVRA